MGKKRHTPETSRVDQLPDDVLIHILSFCTTLSEKACTSILSRRWRYLWLYTARLDFDATTLLPEDQLQKCHDWYIAWVNKVIDQRAALRGTPPVKNLRIWYELNASKGCHIDKWIDFAAANPVETLHLEFNAYIFNMHHTRQYKLSNEPRLRAPLGLSNIKSLKSLFLSCVNVSKEFIEFILSSRPLLEDLSLYFAGCYTKLDVSGVTPLRLKRLKITSGQDFALTKLCAPYLTFLYYKSGKFEPQKIDVPMLTDLSIGDIYESQPLNKYLEPFRCYFHQLERLELIMKKAEAFILKQVPKLVKLKYLQICVNGYDEDLNPYSDRVITLINACPMLETFAMKIVFIEGICRPLPTQRHQKKLRKLERNCSLRCLKKVELYGGDGKTIDQDVTRFIIRNAPNLEKLFVDIHISGADELFPRKRPKLAEVAKTKAKELCRRSRSHIVITVVG